MIAMCATLVGLVKFVSSNAGVDTVVDESAAVIGIIFLGSAVLSYLSIRSPLDLDRWEGWADRTFLLGIVTLVVAVLVLAL